MSITLKVGKTAEIQEGTMKALATNGREILLARVGDVCYAADNRCPHLKARLSHGSLEGTVVTCPRHGSRFDLQSGEVVRWLQGGGLLSRIGRAIKPPRPLHTYKVKIEDEQIFIDI